ncbi:2TM domain-containing protein [Kordia sp. YSTF-M3]|uniref:2TM domain-containing protein n=1 Tax=Kordia aestuariivivens TaxID=2759037 RepID=A0ABR7Q5K9_9FLAO|nr:2TM domain-containing protein [Kordia aestuariivivens]MBC8753850.1 2TM domain-containing protein [Kordia aestuariivivens]
MKKLPSSSKFKDYAEEERYIYARKKVEKIKGFYIHFAVYIIINVFLLTIIALNMDEGDNFWEFGHFSTAFFWGIGIVFHAFGAFGSGVLFGKNWEERKIKKYMSKNERNWE